jgi:hypothetical protein
MARTEFVVALFGAGVVRNAWLPVLRALQQTDFPDVATQEAANFVLARLVYIGREVNRSEATSIRERFRASFDQIRQAIGTELTAAEARGELTVQPEFRNVLDQLVRRAGADIALGTTNWDTVIERALAQEGASADLPVVHLHGTCNSSGTLYFPTEVAEEPYRTATETAELTLPRDTLVRAMQRATHLILYGLALSPLDAELGQVLASGMNGSQIKEVMVVNPDYPAVAERVAGLTDLGTGPIPVIGVHPQDLRRRWTYSRTDLDSEKERLRTWSEEGRFAAWKPSTSS